MTSSPPSTSADPRYYGRRKGKRLKAGRQALVDTLLPRLSLVLPAGEGVVDPWTLFPDMPSRPAAIWLEVGFGGGEHLVHQAATHPEIGFIGAEPFLNGTAKLLAAIHDQGLTNIRILGDDVRPLLDRLPDGCLSRAFLLHPDPWPKTRHAGRRFVNTDNLDRLARLLQPGSEFRVASDDPVYQRWTLMVAPAHAAFHWRVSGPDDWRTRWADACPTRYGEKAIREGRTPLYFTFVRR